MTICTILPLFGARPRGEDPSPPKLRLPPLLVAGMLLALAGHASCGRNPGDRPNLILFMVDTLRADHLGYHGYGRDTTPNLDRFAEEAVAFMNHHAHASRTGPSVASLFTGLHVRSHGVVNPLNQWDGIGLLEEELTTMAELLKEGDYRCGAVVANPNVYPRYGFAQGFDDYITVPMHTGAGDINIRACRWIRRAADGGGPFFLYLHYMDPHSPYGALPPLDRRFVDPEYAGPITGEHLQLDAILSGRLDASPSDRQHLRDLYDQDVHVFDMAFGLFPAFLERQGLADRTVIIVVSDHGEEFFEHGGVLHGYTLYREQLHVPCLIRAPGKAPHAVHAVTRNIDLLPTVLDLLDLPHPAGLQGQSLVPLMGGASMEDLPVLSETGIRAVRTVKSRAMQWRGWKYIEKLLPVDAAPELYEIAVDPEEEKDLYAAQPGQAKEMAGIMERFMKGLPVKEGRSVTLDREGLEQLRALGYVEDRKKN